MPIVRVVDMNNKATIHKCENFNDAIQVHIHHCSRKEPYIYHGNIELSYTDEKPCRKKSCKNFIRNFKMGLYSGGNVIFY